MTTTTIKPIDGIIETTQQTDTSIDTNKELLENLDQEMIFQVRGEKKLDKKIYPEEEKKEALAIADQWENKLLLDIGNLAENNKIDRKIATKATRVGIEIIRNICCYSINNKSIIFKLIKIEDKTSNKTEYKIRSRNYYKDPNGKLTTKLEKRLKNGNTLDLEILKKNWQTQMEKEELNHYDNAGVGYIQIARSLRRENLKPFEYKFTKQKDGTVRFDLTINLN